MDRAVGMGLKLLSRLSGSKLLARAGLSDSLERLLAQGGRAAVGKAAEVQRRAAPLVQLLAPVRMDSKESARPKDVFDLTPTDAQRLVRDSMQRFARDRLRPSALAADEQGAPPAVLLAEAHALGLTQLAVPEALGGAGELRSPITNALVAEELARGDMGLALAALAPVSVAHALVDCGTAEQQSTYLPRLIEDDFVPAALALLEPQPLFDPYHLTTRATPQGRDFVLRGQKALVPLAEDAALFVVFAELFGRPEAFLVERGAPGLTVRAEPAMGLRAAKLGRVVLEDVRVPASARLGGPAGCDVARLIDLARVGISALSVGTCDAILDYVKRYCRERSAFGEPIVHRQSVAFAIANIALELDGMRLMVLRAASRAEQGRSFQREAALARIQCADKAMQIATDGVQLLGGHGFIKEHPVELWYRQLRAVGIFEGALLI